MSTEDADLEALAQDGTMDCDRWPALLDRLLPCLKSIVYDNFPLPSIPLHAGLQPLRKEDVLTSNRDTSCKDDHPETEPKVEVKTTETSKPDEIPQDQDEADQDTDMKDEPRGTKRERDPASQSPPTARTRPPAPTLEPPPDTLPPQLLTLLQTIQSTLSTSFAAAPPHTAQRLAELILRPRQHYRTLPSYLRALDRIVSVASPITVFPLPCIAPNATSNGQMLNGTSPSPDPTNRDSLGGAELTEIPWLRTEGSPPLTVNGPTTSDLRTESTSLIDGPNGAGSIETVTVSVNGVASGAAGGSAGSEVHVTPAQPGISQGELLRQEQEAGIVTVPTTLPTARVTRSSAAASAAANRAVGATVPSSMGGGEGPDDLMPGDVPADGEETVHVRGPNVIGMEDMGPQAPGSGLEGGLDVQGALGRRVDAERIAHAVRKEDEESEGTKENEVEKKDEDGDTIVVDADGVPGEEGARKDAAGLEKVP